MTATRAIWHDYFSTIFDEIGIVDGDKGRLFLTIDDHRHHRPGGDMARLIGGAINETITCEQEEQQK